jgi:hypothetical protein
MFTSDLADPKKQPIEIVQEALEVAGLHICGDLKRSWCGDVVVSLSIDGDFAQAAYLVASAFCADTRLMGLAVNGDYYLATIRVQQ